MSTHKVGIGIALGALALGTGIGALIAGATVGGILLGVGAGILGGAASALDAGPCINGHNRAACGGLIFGLVGGAGGLLGGAGSWLGFAGVITAAERSTRCC